MRLANTLLALCIISAAGVLPAQDDIVMKAMRDEMARSMQLLQLADLEKPYFIGYRVVENEGVNASASFGALNQSSEGRSRMFIVEVRVGDYKLDNTNFYSPAFGMTSMVQVFNGVAPLPLDDDYRELRRQIWLATDATYKKAVEDFSKKRASLQNKTRTDDTPDFTREASYTTTAEEAPIRADRSRWETLVRSLSGLFKQMPDIYTSSVSLGAANSLVRYVNSEGTSYTRRQPRLMFNAHAATQAVDGQSLDDFIWLQGKSLAELPSEQELASRLRDLGRRLTELRSASTLETYNGPVLVEGEAAVQIFRLAFMPNLLGARRVTSDLPNFQQAAGQGENPFMDKIGARVLPVFLSVADNPTLAEYHNTRLAGFCKVDEDGIPTRETRLVEKGILKTLLTSRNPVRGIEHSSGSRHAGHAAPSNIFVSAENGLSAAELRAKFLDVIKQRNKEFGILVRRMRNVLNPVLAYKLYPDGREELVRGAQFTDLNAAAFKDILAASKEQNVLTIQFNPRPAPGSFTMSDENYVSVTLLVPSLLFEDVTIRKIRGETPNPPVARHPFFDR